MSKPSHWPLSKQSRRIVAPVVISELLQNHPLSQDCFPLAVGRYKKAHGHQMSRKRHDDNLLIYCEDGKGAIETPDWRGEVKAGEIVLLPQNTPHQYAADPDTPWSIYWCHFSGHQSQEYLYHMTYEREQPVQFIGHSPELIAQFQALLAEASTAYNDTAMVYAANMMKQLLTFIAKLLHDTQRDKQQFNPHGIQAFMLKNLDKTLSLDALAAEAKLSKFHFSKKYKHSTGHAPIQHFIAMKMEYARYLLDTSDMNIQDIAYRVGYDDSLHFSRIFKKTNGRSPRDYRKQQ